MALGSIHYISKSDWAILHDNKYSSWWEAFCETEFFFDAPRFYGQLDHVDATKNQVTFHDNGCNGSDNTFTVRCNKK
jgi:hypothetical protein